MRLDRLDEFVAAARSARDVHLAHDEAACLRALARDPEDAEALCSLGCIRDQLGRHGEAAACWRRALELDPALGDTWAELGRRLAADGRRGEAANALRRAVVPDPGDFDRLDQLGDVLAEDGATPKRRRPTSGRSSPTGPLPTSAQRGAGRP